MRAITHKFDSVSEEFLPFFSFTTSNIERGWEGGGEGQVTREGGSRFNFRGDGANDVN